MSSSRILAVSAVLAVAGLGCARADDAWSFTERAQHEQRIGRAPTGADEVVATNHPTIAEAGSFVARVEASQGVRAGEVEASGPDRRAEIGDEAASFTARAQASQGLPRADEEEEGAASGEPDAD